MKFEMVCRNIVELDTQMYTERVYISMNRILTGVATVVTDRRRSCHATQLGQGCRQRALGKVDQTLCRPWN